MFALLLLMIVQNWLILSLRLLEVWYINKLPISVQFISCKAVCAHLYSIRLIKKPVLHNCLFLHFSQLNYFFYSLYCVQFALLSPFITSVFLIKSLIVCLDLGLSAIQAAAWVIYIPNSQSKDKHADCEKRGKTQWEHLFIKPFWFF